MNSNFSISSSVQDTCMAVYTKDKQAKCRTPVLELLIKVSFRPKEYRSTAGRSPYLCHLLITDLKKPICTHYWKIASLCSILSTGSPNNKSFQRRFRPSNLSNIRQILRRALSEEQTTRFWWVKPRLGLMRMTLYRHNVICIIFVFNSFCNSPRQNLWAAGSSCRGSPQRDGQQLWQTVQSLSGGAKRTGVITDKRRRENLDLYCYCVYSVFCCFLLDDFFDKGTKTVCCSWMFERNHCSNGQLH